MGHNKLGNNNLGCLITQGHARGFRTLRHPQGRIKSMSNGHPYNLLSSLSAPELLK